MMLYLLVIVLYTICLHILMSYRLNNNNPINMGELVNLSSNHLRANPEHDTIFIDLPNAFNECFIDHVAANQIVEKCPILAGLFELFYKDSSNIWLRNDSDDWEAAIAEEGCVSRLCNGPLRSWICNHCHPTLKRLIHSRTKLIPFLEPIRTIL